MGSTMMGIGSWGLSQVDTYFLQVNERLMSTFAPGRPRQKRPISQFPILSMREFIPSSWAIKCIQHRRYDINQHWNQYRHICRVEEVKVSFVVSARFSSRHFSFEKDENWRMLPTIMNKLHPRSHPFLYTHAKTVDETDHCNQFNGSIASRLIASQMVSSVVSVHLEQMWQNAHE